MNTDTAIILDNTKIARDVYRMILSTKLAPFVKCGQFVEVEVPGYFLRRPISVCEVDGDTITLVYKVVGQGTNVMHNMQQGEKISLFGPCGTGFPVEEEDVVLIGGGVGVPPLVETAKQYRQIHKNVIVVLGFNTKEDMILVDAFQQLGCKVCIATMDGSFGTKGTVMDAIADNALSCDFVLSCGPLPMLKAISKSFTHGYISLEARMACGMGACMGCVVKDIHGESLRVCKDGPVFEIGKVVL